MVIEMDKQCKIGSVVFEDWHIKRKIGEGSFGEVFEILREDFGEVYRAALKVITVPQNDAELRSVMDEGMTRTEAEQYFYSVVEDIVREFAIMSRLKGTANVVSYEDHKVIKHDNGIGWDILIRMELLTPLLVYAQRNKFTRRDIIRLGIEMCKALELCQKYNIIHRDIKPENIFVSDNGDFKLGDFGIARTIEKTTSGLSKKGTYNYMAPEVYRGGEYGFSVDLYSLGIVLYRLLNKNRVPFLPPAPEAITFNARELALTRRMNAESLPPPFYAEGRLMEIVLKACAYEPKERYSSPAQMRQELEAILYEQEDTEFIYPFGDEVYIEENQYFSQTPINTADEQVTDDLTATASILSSRAAKSKKSEDPDKNDKSLTRGIFRNTGAKVNAVQSVASEQTGNDSRKKIVVLVICCLLCVGAGIGCWQYQAANKENNYQRYMDEGLALCSSNPEQAADLFLQAQQLYPKAAEPYIAYAYALYCSHDYEQCVEYITNDLALGKQYELSEQNKLSEILGSAYFELGNYANAAAAFAISAAGEDITVTAMRDYAVSLGRLGDAAAAAEVLQKMQAAGADDEIIDYVLAEAAFAQQDYIAAANGFQAVLASASDIDLQKRALRSLAEVYRDCSALARTGNSPIASPAKQEVELLADGIVKYGLTYDSALWEMLAMAYFEAYHTEPDVGDDYLIKAAECFNRVLEAGVSKDYLYSNLYAIYYELNDYEAAEIALQRYETAFVNDYTPHALRSMLLITQENNKPQNDRNYNAAYKEYEQAKALLQSSDDTAYFQQVESLVNQLKAENWL